MTRPPMTAAPILAADLGGTKITVGVVHPGGAISARRTLPTGANRGPDAILTDLTSALTQAQTEAGAAGDPEPVAVGIGTAGVVDSATGTITHATDAIPGWVGTELGPRAAEQLGLPVRVLNDVHAHGLGEAVFGAGAGKQSMLLLAVGTGIGGAIVRDGAVMIGQHSAAAHVGHLPVPEAAGIPCPCGRTGHVEGIGSGPGVLAAYQRAGGQAADTREVVARAKAGEELAGRVLRSCAFAVGRVLGALLNVLDPEVAVLSGGMAGAGPLWWQAVHDGVAHDAIDLVAGTEVLPARAGADAALLGAAQFARVSS